MCNSCWNATGFVILHTSLFILWSRTHAVMHTQGSEHSIKGYLISYHGSPEAQTWVATLGHRCFDPAEPSHGLHRLMFDIWQKSAVQIQLWPQSISTPFLESLKLCMINNLMVGAAIAALWLTLAMTWGLL